MATQRVRLYTRGYLEGTNNENRKRALAAVTSAQTSASATSATDLVAAESALLATQSAYYIDFDVSPDINESAGANYAELSDIRAPASILIYTGSPSRTYSINAKLVSRTTSEANSNAKRLNVLRSWRMPEALTGGFNVNIPTLLHLSGYGGMFKDIPVVMTSLSIDIQSEFDVIANSNTSGGEVFVPIIVPVSITLKECRNTEGELDGLNTFDISKFRAGTLEKW